MVDLVATGNNILHSLAVGVLLATLAFQEGMNACFILFLQYVGK